MQKFIKDFSLVEKSELSSSCSLLKLVPSDGERIPDLLPGQFVQVRVDNCPTTFLRRPISICNVDRDNNHLWLLIRKAGDGTKSLVALESGAVVNIILPLGNGFSQSVTDGRVLLIGGGVGVAPLMLLGKCLMDSGLKPEFLLGARSKAEHILLDEFSKIGTVHVSTDDGSLGEVGVVTKHSVMTQPGWSKIYCCGPAPMMKAVAKVAKTLGCECEVSLENMMACGLGACLCCVEKTVKGNVCVCTEGPVFNINELTW